MRILALLFALISGPAWAQSFSTVPYIFILGQPANASQVMANFNAVVAQGNSVANYIQSQIAAVTPPPSGSFLFFNLTSCPAGWTAAPGPGFPRGLDLGRGQDTTGTPLGGVEFSTLQDHTHSTGNGATAMGTVSVVQGGGGAHQLNSASSINSVTNATSGGVTGATSASVSFPKNVTLLLCQKN